MCTIYIVIPLWEINPRMEIRMWAKFLISRVCVIMAVPHKRQGERKKPLQNRNPIKPLETMGCVKWKRAAPRTCGSHPGVGFRLTWAEISVPFMRLVFSTRPEYIFGCVTQFWFIRQRVLFPVISWEDVDYCRNQRWIEWPKHKARLRVALYSDSDT